MNAEGRRTDIRARQSYGPERISRISYGSGSGVDSNDEDQLARKSNTYFGQSSDNKSKYSLNSDLL